MQTQKYYEILVAMRSQALVLQAASSHSTCEKTFSKSASLRGDADPTPRARPWPLVDGAPWGPPNQSSRKQPESHNEG